MSNFCVMIGPHQDAGGYFLIRGAGTHGAQAGPPDIFQLQVKTFRALHRWRIHIPGISGANGVASDAEFTSDAKSGRGPIPRMRRQVRLVSTVARIGAGRE